MRDVPDDGIVHRVLDSCSKRSSLKDRPGLAKDQFARELSARQELVLVSDNSAGRCASPTKHIGRRPGATRANHAIDLLVLGASP